METNEIIIGHNAASESCCWIAPSLMNGALCLAGCLTGATVGAYLRSCRNEKTWEMLYGINEKDNTEQKKRKMKVFWSKYKLEKRNDEKNKGDHNNIIDNSKKINIIDDNINNKSDNELWSALTAQEKQDFMEDPDIYGTGWLDFLCCQDPKIRITKIPEKDKEEERDEKEEEEKQPINGEDIETFIKKGDVEGRDNKNLKLLLDIILKQPKEKWGVIYKAIVKDDEKLFAFFKYLGKHYSSKQNIPDEVVNFFLGILGKLNEDQLRLFLFTGKEKKDTINDNDISNSKINHSEDSIDEDNNSVLLDFLLKILEGKKKDPRLAEIRKKIFNVILNFDDLTQLDDENNEELIAVFFQLMGLCGGNLTKKDIETNIENIKVFFDKIKELYPQLHAVKTEILKFAMDILNKIEKPKKCINNTESDNSIDNKDENKDYQAMIAFIFDKIEEDEDILQQIFNDGRYREKIIAIVMNHLEDPKNNDPEMFAKFVEVFLAFLKNNKKADIQDFKNFDTLLIALIDFYKSKNQRLPQDVWNIIIESYKQELEKQKKDKNNNNNNNSKKNNTQSHPLLKCFIDNIGIISDEDIKSLAGKLTGDQLITFLFAIFQRKDIGKIVNNDQEKNKSKKPLNQLIFEKIVNKENVENIALIMFNNKDYREILLNNGELQKCFLKIFLDTPQLIINEIKNKKDSSFCDFFILLWKSGIEQELLKAEDIKNLLIDILTYVQDDIENQEQLDMLWKILTETKLIEKLPGDNDMPDSFWKFVSTIFQKCKEKGIEIPSKYKETINELIKRSDKNISPTFINNQNNDQKKDGYTKKYIESQKRKTKGNSKYSQYKNIEQSKYQQPDTTSRVNWNDANNNEYFNRIISTKSAVQIGSNKTNNNKKSVQIGSNKTNKIPFNGSTEYRDNYFNKSSASQMINDPSSHAIRETSITNLKKNPFFDNYGYKS